MAFCKLLSVLVLIHNTAGLHGAEVKSSIIGGGEAPQGRWPGMVHLNITSDGRIKWRCGGTILKDQWLLTAAHCWDRSRNPKLSRCMAWIGAHSLHKASVRYMAIENVISHPEYRATGNGYVNDIALVYLKKKIQFSTLVSPVVLPGANSVFGSSAECWITGWGYIGNDVPLPDPETLQQLRIPIIPQSECQAQLPELTTDMMCAGDRAGGKDACKGDYGGPLMCRAGSGFVQAGIMSYGSPNGCGLPGRPGVYTQVSKYLHFINSYIHRGDEASTEM